MNADKEKATMIVKAMCVLHNYLRTACDTIYTPAGYCDYMTADGELADGSWRTEANQHLEGIAPTTARNASQNAIDIRDYFQAYFNGVGSVPWQLRHVRMR